MRLSSRTRLHASVALCAAWSLLALCALPFAPRPATASYLAGTQTSANAYAIPLYCSNGTSVTVGPSSIVRATMLPPASTGTSLDIPANMMGVGNFAVFDGEGQVSANTVAAGTFTLTPSFTVAGTKYDLPATTITITVGAGAVCIFHGVFTQTTSGVLFSGWVMYGPQNGMTNIWTLNTGYVVTTGTPADYTQKRTVGIDATWSQSNVNNSVTSNSVRGILYRPVQ